VDGDLPTSNSKAPNDRGAVGEDDVEDEGEEIRKVMVAMEAELNEHGALDLNPTLRKLASLQGGAPTAQPLAKGKGKQSSVPVHGESEIQKGGEETSDESDDDEELDIDFNLAKNLLESFKSQTGMPGPGGNLMGMMGLHMPRDEGNEARKGAM
jgi:hypothetical protein